MEIQIQVPYGHVSAKWWGRRDVRPILCIHGSQDNAASFDALIPLLPDVGYLAIDLPGHGHSSRIPNGLVYTTVGELYIVNYIIRQFGWKKVSLMGHSQGAISCFIYASTYPAMVDLVIALDALYPFPLLPSQVDLFIAGFVEARESDQLNIAGVEPTTYSIEELIDKINSQTLLSVSKASALYLLARDTKESSNAKGRYYFTRDPRVKMFQMPYFTKEISENFAKSIACPLLYVKALHSTFYSSDEQQECILKIFMDKPDFEMITVDGGHYIHLNDPSSTSDAVSDFIIKHVTNVQSSQQPSKL